MGQSVQRNGALSSATRLLDVHELVAGYRSPIVGPVSFSVDRGEIVGLTGSNGSGKTTIFNAIIGTARTLGGDVRRAPGARVAFLRQYPVRLAEMPLVGSELLRLTGAHSEPLPDALKGLVDSRLDRLSGGQYQLLQVWACLASPADLVMLDEPTNNMDPGVIEALGGILLASRGSRKGILVISHAHQWLQRLCTRTVPVDP